MKLTHLIILVPLLLLSCGRKDGLQLTESAQKNPELEGARSAEVYYLHLYSTLYDIHVPVQQYSRDDEETPDNECIATIAISPGVSFFANIPNHYEPSIRIEGVVMKDSDSFYGSFKIWLEGVDVAYLHEQTSSIPTDILVPIEVSGSDFHFAISARQDPYSLLSAQGKGNHEDNLE